MTIHVLVRTSTVHVRHQASFRMQKFQKNEKVYVQDSSICLLQQIVFVTFIIIIIIIIIICLRLL